MACSLLYPPPPLAPLYVSCCDGRTWPKGTSDHLRIPRALRARRMPPSLLPLPRGAGGPLPAATPHSPFPVGYLPITVKPPSPTPMVYHSNYHMPRANSSRLLRPMLSETIQLCHTFPLHVPLLWLSHRHKVTQARHKHRTKAELAHSAQCTPWTRCWCAVHDPQSRHAPRGPCGGASSDVTRQPIVALQGHQPRACEEVPLGAGFSTRGGRQWAVGPPSPYANPHAVHGHGRGGEEERMGGSPYQCYAVGA